MLLKSMLTLAGAGIIAEKSTKETVNLLRQRQLQLGILQSAGLPYIIQMITRVTCSIQLELVERYAHSMQRPKLLHTNNSNLRYTIVSSGQALLQHRKPCCSLLRIRSRCLTSGNPMMNIYMDNHRLVPHPSICSTKYHMLL